MTESMISLKLKNSLSELTPLIQQLENLCDRFRLSKRCECEASLVVEELFTNIVSYGYTDNAEHWIDIEITYENGTLTIRMEDDGIPFNPMDAEKPDFDSSLDQRSVGGLGVHLVKHFTKEIDYERRGNKNILTLKKTFYIDSHK